MKKSFDTLWGFRAILFLIVFFFHAGGWKWISNSPLYALFGGSGGGILGVAFFIMLSGFLNGMKDLNDEFSLYLLLKNWLKKIKKYYIMHILTFFISFILFFRRFEWLKMFSNILLLQSWIPKREYYFSYNGVSWYLSMFSFLIFLTPLLRKSLKKFDKNNLLFIYFFCVVLRVLLTYTLIKSNVESDIAHYILYIFPPVRVIDYYQGMLLGRYYILDESEWTVQKQIILQIIALVIFIYLIGIWYILPDKYMSNIYTIFGIGCVIYILAKVKTGFMVTFLASTQMVGFGKKSFYYYMVHQVILQFFYKVEDKVIPEKFLWEYACFGILLSIILTYAVVECYLKIIYPKVVNIKAENSNN